MEVEHSGDVESDVVLVFSEVIVGKQQSQRQQVMQVELQFWLSVESATFTSTLHRNKRDFFLLFTQMWFGVKTKLCQVHFIVCYFLKSRTEYDSLI